MEDREILGLSLVLTCPGCPEQYDVFDGDKQVGYLRLRWGEFTVNYPDVRGEEIFSAEPDGDGNFTDQERDYYLLKACHAINARMMKAGSQ